MKPIKNTTTREDTMAETHGVDNLCKLNNNGQNKQEKEDEFEKLKNKFENQRKNIVKPNLEK